MIKLYNKFVDDVEKENIIKRLIEINANEEILEIFKEEDDVTIFRNLLDKYHGSSIDLYFLYKKVDYQEKKEIIINHLIEKDDFDVIFKIFLLNNEVRGKYYRKVNTLIVNKYFLKKKIKRKTIFYEIYQSLVDIELKERIIARLVELDAHREINKIYNSEKIIYNINKYFLDKYKSNPQKLYRLYEQVDEEIITDKIIHKLIELDAHKEINKIFENEKSNYTINKYFLDKYKSNPRKLYKLYKQVDGEKIKAENELPRCRASRYQKKVSCAS